MGLFDVFSKGRGSIASATEETGRFRSSLSSIPSVVKTAIVVGGIALAIDQLIQLQQQYSKTQQWFKDQADQNAVGFQSWTERQAERKQTGQETPRSEVMGEALKAWQALNPDDALTRSVAMQGFGQRVEALWGSYRPYGSRWDIVSPSGLFEPERAAPIFKKSAPMLADPAIMGEFLKKSQGELKASGSFWGFSTATVKAQVERFNQALAMAFPESYRAAVEAQQKEAARLAEESKDTSAALKALPTSLDRFTAALDTFAHRVSGLDLSLPPYTLPGGGDGGGARNPPAPRRNSLLENYDPLGGFRQQGYFEQPGDKDMGLPGSTARDSRSVRAVSVRKEMFPAAHVGQPGGTFNVTGSGVHIGRISVEVPPGSKAADDPHVLARYIGEEVGRQVSERLDGRELARTLAYEVGIQRERA